MVVVSSWKLQSSRQTIFVSQPSTDGRTLYGSLTSDCHQAKDGQTVAMVRNIQTAMASSIRLTMHRSWSFLTEFACLPTTTTWSCAATPIGNGRNGMASMATW